MFDQLFVEANRLLGDSSPAEGLLRAPASCIPEAPTPLRIVQKSMEPSSKVLRKFFGMKGKTRDRILVERD